LVKQRQSKVSSVTYHGTFARQHQLIHLLTQIQGRIQYFWIRPWIFGKVNFIFYIAYNV